MAVMATITAADTMMTMLMLPTMSLMMKAMMPTLLLMMSMTPMMSMMMARITNYHLFDHLNIIRRTRQKLLL